MFMVVVGGNGLLEGSIEYGGLFLFHLCIDHFLNFGDGISDHSIYFDI
jgi:hypothetical protein